MPRSPEPARRPALLLLRSLLVALILAQCVGAPALANGSTIRVALSYLPGVSNWGPDNAAGVAEIVRAEGDVRLTVSGLPRLTTDLYQLWLVDLKSGTQYSIGKFNVSATGAGGLETTADITNVQFDLVVISVESEPDLSPNADSRLSIAGRYSTTTATPARAGVATPAPAPASGASPAAGTPPAVAGTPGSPPTGPTAAGTPTAPLPSQLPRTGESGPAGLVSLLAAGCIALATFGGLYRLARRR